MELIKRVESLNSTLFSCKINKPIFALHFQKQLIQESSRTIYTLQFGLVCLSSFLFSASFNMLIPELPAYLSGMGGATYKGLIIALFTLTAGISRPFSGKLTDTIGRVPVPR
jgi:hypothetical protein